MNIESMFLILQKRAAIGCTEGGAGVLPCSLMCLTSRMYCSGHKFIPSSGEMRQKGAHVGSLVHTSQATLFLSIQRCSKSDFGKDRQLEMVPRPHSGLVSPGLPLC